ncbi:MAG: NAD(P)H-binding protein [Proteobacteria bacterium]|nr:NAD(P)H-binding protein [Pseudomonadota bacterium]MBU1686892.1 NAD(P)H-binding protein [Pseudomonadota bacterium]
MKNAGIHMVTGAFGFSGKYIAQNLLQKGLKVATLTNSPNRQSDFHQTIDALPFNFDQPDKLVESLHGVEVLYNTYWVRFNHRTFTHNKAVENTLKLFTAAKRAGVKKIVHTSITNPSLDSELEYFQGKAVLEEALVNSGINYSILRPAVIFGHEDILINNIAWVLRTLPVFPIFGYGSYRLQPIYVRDFADLAVQEGENGQYTIINAIGPETFTYRELVEKIGDIIGVNRPLITVSPTFGYLAGAVISKFVKDIVVTREEIAGLMADLLCVEDNPTGTTALTAWVRKNKELLGKKYTSELARRIDRSRAYA